MTKYYQCPHCHTICEPEDAYDDPNTGICTSCGFPFRKWAVNEVKI